MRFTRVPSLKRISVLREPVITLMGVGVQGASSAVVAGRPLDLALSGARETKR